MGILLDAEPVVGDGAMTSAVVVATHRRPGPLRAMLASLAASDGSGDLEEVVIVENGERAGAYEIVAEMDRLLPVRYDFFEQANKSASLNHALDGCRADLLIFFDDDVQIGPGTVAAYLEAASHFGHGHFFGGPVVPDYETGPPPDWLVDVLPYSATGFDAHSEGGSPTSFLGANWAAFSEDLRAAGGFSTRLGPGAGAAVIGEETELQERLSALGCDGIFLAAASVEHSVQGEHLTIAWARQRRYRQKLAEALRDPPHYDGPRVLGVPRYLWRAIAGQYARVIRDRLVRPRSKLRARSEMELARLLAQLRAHWSGDEVGIEGGDLSPEG